MNWQQAFTVVSAGLACAAWLTVAGVSYFRPDWSAPRRFLARQWRKRFKLAAKALGIVEAAFRAAAIATAHAEASVSSYRYRLNAIHRATYRPPLRDEIGAPI